MKKKLMATLLAACAALGLWAATETVDGIVWNYTVSGGKAQVGIGGYNGPRAVSTSTTGAIAIPPTLGGNPVTSVKEYAFDGCSGLTSVTIPDGVTSIGENAFRGCSDALFDTKTIPGVKLVGGWAVGYTSSLSGYLDLTGVRGIADSAFYSCSGLTSVTIPDGVTSIGSAAFRYCSGLTSVTIPDGVTSLGSYGFSGCSGLTNVTIGTGITSIRLDAFSGCRGLTSVTIPYGVTSIGENAFRNCSGLTSVTIPYGVTSIGQCAFDGCSDALFDTTNIPGVKLVGGWAVGYTSSLSGPLDLTGVRGIGESAFSYCSGLTGVTIPGGVARIGNFVFSSCSGLTSVTIPNSVTSIGDSAFSGCSGLTSVTMPNSVTSIGFHAFQNCSGLTSATIGNGVTNIAYQAFYGCTALADVKCYPDAAALVWGYARYDVKADGSTVIHVKASQLAAYQAKFSNVKATFVGDLPDSITVTIGSGDTMDDSLPTTSFYNYSISHQIYTSEEIGTAGTISSIAFKNGGIEKTRTLDIYLVHTDKSSFDGASDWIPVSETDKVFSGSVTFIHGGWTEIPLDTPFDYNGMDNLAVIVDDNTMEYYTALSCYAFAAPGMAIHIYSDTTNFDPLSPGGYDGVVENIKNQIQLVIAKGDAAAAAVAEFADGDVYVSESETMSIVVNGGSESRPTSVKLCLSYLNAAAADIDLKNATVNGETPKGGLKFPLTLAWDTGDTEPKTIAIPVKPDKAVEDDEMLLFQLADAVGMEMGETDICAVTMKDPAFGELRNKIKDGTATKAESNNWIRVNHDGIPYFCGVAMPGDGGKATGSGYCPVGKKVTLKATAGKGWKFLGWRQGTGNGELGTGNGFVAETASLVIDRSAKPAANSKTSTTLTDVTEDTTFYAVFEGDPRVTATPVAFDEEKGLFVASDGGKVTGAGCYAPGKKVTLKATATKGFVFGGWYVVGEADALSQAASFSFEMGEEDIDLYARFVTSDADKGSIAATFNGAAMPSPSDGSPAMTTNVWAGVYLEWPLTSEALSQTTVKVAGLPSGLKFTAKDVVDSKTKQVTVPANTIYGAPTAASKADGKGGVKPSDVKITVTTAGKSSITYLVKLTVDPLPAWAVGTFDGEVGNGELGTGNGKSGTVALTVAANGKISGKILEGGRTWALSASEFSRVERVDRVDGSDEFYATVIGKAGKEVITNEVTVSAENGIGVAIGIFDVQLSTPNSQLSTYIWSGYQNLWKRADTKAEMPLFKSNIVVDYPLGEPGDLNNTVKLTFKKDGVVSFAGKVGGASVSGTSQLVNDGDGWKVTLYTPPKPTARPPFVGFCKTLAVALTLDAQNIVTEVAIGGGDAPVGAGSWFTGEFNGYGDAQFPTGGDTEFLNGLFTINVAANLSFTGTFFGTDGTNATFSGTFAKQVADGATNYVASGVAITVRGQAMTMTLECSPEPYAGREDGFGEMWGGSDAVPGEPCITLNCVWQNIWKRGDLAAEWKPAFASGTEKTLDLAEIWLDGKVDGDSLTYAFGADGAVSITGKIYGESVNAAATLDLEGLDGGSGTMHCNFFFLANGHLYQQQFTFPRQATVTATDITLDSFVRID